MTDSIFHVSLWDRRPSGGLGEQDLTHRFDAEASHLVGNAFDRITASEMVFALKAADSYHIDSFTEPHAGYRFPDTHHWDPAKPLYAGNITKHVGTFDATHHLFTCTVSNYNLLFDRTEVGVGGSVGTWPVPVTDPPAGFPPGWAVSDWLVGLASDGKPYDGIVPAHWQHIQIGQIDPVFESIILDETALPAQGLSTVYGYFGFMSLRALLDEIVKVARWKGLHEGLDVKPTYFFVPAVSADGLTLEPAFYFIDLNSQESGIASATYALTPTGDQRPIGYPYVHTRDAQAARMRTTVKGVGTDDDGLIYYSYLKEEGDARYPTYYQKVPGWSMAPINESTINQRAQAQRYATDLGDAGWGPEGTIQFPTDYPEQAGHRAALDIPPDGMEGDVFPVTSVEGTLIPHEFQLTLGHRPRNLADILVPRPDAPMPQTDAGTQGGGLNSSAAGIGRAGANVAGVPRTRPMVDTPVHNDQNVIMGMTNAVTGQIVRQNPADAPATGEAPGPPPADINILSQIWDSDALAWRSTAWVDRYGTPHHQKLAFAWLADGMVPFAVAERLTIRRAQVPTDPAQAGVTFDVVINDAGSLTTVATITVGVLSDPFEVLPGQQIEVTAGSVPAGGASLTLVSGDPL